MTDQTSLVVETLPVGPFQCNCSIVYDPETKEGIVVDPGGHHDLILKKIEESGCRIVAILLTHGHTDHILGVGHIKEATGAPIYLHDEDRPLWENIETQCRMFGLPYEPVPEPDKSLRDGDRLPLGDGVVLHTPGHSPGSVSFSFPDSKLVICGDVLFCGSIGRTDLWGGSFEVLAQSIRDRLYTLDEDTKVITGHGPDTSIRYERINNPFVKPLPRS